MAKSKGIGRGGARVGSGRPRKLTAAEVEAGASVKPAMKKPAPIAASSACAPNAPVAPSTKIETEPKTASELEGLALATLRQVMRSSQQDSSRVAAAKEVLVRVAAEKEASGASGKKQVRLVAAEARIAMGGKFAPPEPPAGYRAN